MELPADLYYSIQLCLCISTDYLKARVLGDGSGMWLAWKEAKPRTIAYLLFLCACHAPPSLVFSRKAVLTWANVIAAYWRGGLAIGIDFGLTSNMDQSVAVCSLVVQET